MNWFEDPIERPGKKPPAARRVREPRRTLNGESKHGVASPAAGTLCGAKRKNGTPCTQAAGWGTDHVGYGSCKHHMGSTPEGRKSGAIDLAQELSQFYGEPIDTNPIDALLDEVRRTAGHIAWLSKLIGSYKIDLTQYQPGDDLPELPPNVAGYLTVYMSERGQLVRVSKAALDAGINERLVQIAEHQGARLADAVDQILNALELTELQRALVPRVVPDILRGLMDNDPPRLIEGVVEEQLDG